jgi:hypothetical protein
MLIPGAGGEAAYWHRVVPLLEARGHQAMAVDLPGPDPAAGLPEYTEIALATIGDGRDDLQRRVARTRLGRDVEVIPAGT